MGALLSAPGGWGLHPGHAQLCKVCYWKSWKDGSGVSSHVWRLMHPLCLCMPGIKILLVIADPYWTESGAVQTATGDMFKSGAQTIKQCQAGPHGHA